MNKPADQPTKNSFAQQADEQAPSLIAELWDFLKYNKKWWLLPIIIVFGFLGVLALLLSSPAAPFIYTLF